MNQTHHCTTNIKYKESMCTALFTRYPGFPCNTRVTCLFIKRSPMQFGLYCQQATFQSTTSILQCDNLRHFIEKFTSAFVQNNSSNNQNCIWKFKYYFTLLVWLNFYSFRSFNIINTRSNNCLFGKRKR